MIDFKAEVTAAEERRLQEFITALRVPCMVERGVDSWVCNSEFESEFRSKLLTHHCFMGSPLFQESFDSAFKSACAYAGLEVIPAPDGQRFWDATIAGRKISLKSTKAKVLREDRLHISKLTEAAWIQDCRTAKKRRDETIGLFEEYCAQVDAIIQLRYFIQSRKYELVEVPVLLFRQVLSVDQSHFASDGPTINIPIGQHPPDFTLKLDRSDAKITIANINKSLCIVHGTWTVGDYEQKSFSSELR